MTVINSQSVRKEKKGVLKGGKLQKRSFNMTKRRSSYEEMKHQKERLLKELGGLKFCILVSTYIDLCI